MTTDNRSWTAGDLYALAVEHGGINLIPADLCKLLRVNRVTVWAVFVHRLHFDALTAVEVADALGLELHAVASADSVLEEAQLIIRAGLTVARP